MKNKNTDGMAIVGAKERKPFQEVGDLFRLPGEIKKVLLLKEGSVATSYRVVYDTGKVYLFQKIGLPKEQLADTMHNVEQVSAYLLNKSIFPVHFHHTYSKENFLELNEACWRVRRYYESFSLPQTDDLEMVKDLGVAVGSFQYLTREFDVQKLRGIDDSFQMVVECLGASKDDAIVHFSSKISLLADALQKGLLPCRVVHRNQKIKSVQLKNRNYFYINLDFATKGIGLSDFAAVALAVSSSADCADEEARFDIEKYTSYLIGFLSSGISVLSKTEKKLMVPALLARAIYGVISNQTDSAQRTYFLELAQEISDHFSEIEEVTTKAISRAKNSRFYLNVPSIDRDSRSPQDYNYKTGDYMHISIPHLIKPKGGKVYSFFKRAFDILSSALGILLLSPFLLLIGLLVVATSRGPMIYVSKRVGKNGRVFNFYKFRSMYKDAEKKLNELLEQNEIEGGVTFKMKNDPRITPFGKFLRKTSIDELPQLFNVLKGDMSIIGPRAALPREVLLYPEEALDRLMVPQGLSGEWQANGRSDTSFDNMIKMDLDYIQNKRSFWYDIGLVFKTILVVITGSGAE